MSLMKYREGLKQKSIVFLRNEPANMAYHETTTPSKMPLCPLMQDLVHLTSRHLNTIRYCMISVALHYLEPKTINSGLV